MNRISGVSKERRHSDNDNDNLIINYFSEEVFLVPCPDRSRETLHRLIIENVLPGTTILTDQWAGYTGLTDLGLDYKVY